MSTFKCSFKRRAILANVNVKCNSGKYLILYIATSRPHSGRLGRLGTESTKPRLPMKHTESLGDASSNQIKSNQIYLRQKEHNATLCVFGIEAGPPVRGGRAEISEAPSTTCANIERSLSTNELARTRYFRSKTQFLANFSPAPRKFGSSLDPGN